jgi:hypothetical protein
MVEKESIISKLVEPPLILAADKVDSRATKSKSQRPRKALF